MSVARSYFEFGGNSLISVRLLSVIQKYGKRLFAAAFLAIAGASTTHAKPEIELHYSPAENLERIDTALMREAKKTIDMAAYVLTDTPSS